MTSPGILALDLGSSRLKAAWVGTDGRIGTVHAADSPARTAQASPESIWRGVADLLAMLLQASEAPEHILAVSLTGLTRSHVFLDEHGQVAGSLIRWDDPYGEGRAAEVAAAYALPPSTPGLGAFHPLARLCQYRHDHGRAPAALLELRDWLNFRLTGCLASDAVAYGRLQVGQCTAAQALSRLGFAADVIPLPRSPASVLGPIQPLADARLQRLEAVPLVTGSFDTWCSTLGMGAIVRDTVYDISGTTEVMGTFQGNDAPVPGAVCLPWTPDLWQVGGPCQTGLGTLAWFARSFLDADGPAATLEAAAQAQSPEPPLCLPYIAGERMPWWSPDLPASFHAVRTQHTRDDFARALVEGVALAHRAALDALGIRPAGTPIHMGGGGSGLEDWCQVRADALGMPILIGGHPESALAGAALAASVALGYYPDLARAQDAVRAQGRIINPDPVRTRYFERRAAAFTTLLHQTLPHP